MVSDEELIRRLRISLDRASAGLEPRSGLLEAVHADLDRRPRRRAARSAIAASVLVAVAVALGAVVVLGRAPRRPVPSRPVHRPARVSPDTVAAPLTLRALPVARYCAAGLRLVPCHSGQRPVTAQPQRLVELSFTARRAAGRGSWYAWNLQAPRGCPQGSASGPTYGPVRRGERLVFDDLVPPGCHGIVSVLVLYWRQSSAPEGGTPVGHSTLRLP
jgi:hypothetical protein